MQLAGHTSAGDGGDGLFVYDDATLLADDGATVVGKWLRQGVQFLNVKHFGAVGGPGTVDDTAAVQATINASCARYGYAALYFPWGNYRITASLTFPSTCTAFVCRGERVFTLCSENIGSAIWCREVVGPVLDINNNFTTGIYSYQLESLTFDGSNGGGALSTTCTGIIPMKPSNSPPTGYPCTYIHIDAVNVLNIATVGARAFDFSRSWWLLVENSFIGGITNGYGIYINSSYIVSSMVTIRKTYLRGNLEDVHIRSNVNSCLLDRCILEYSLVGLAVIMASSVVARGCWFESMGSDVGSLGHALSYKRGGSTDHINTAFYNYRSPVRFENCVFQTIYAGAEAWMEVDGTYSSADHGAPGTTIFDHCTYNDTITKPFFSPASALSLNGGAIVMVNDTFSTGTTGCLGVSIPDARCIADGTLGIVFSSTDVRPAKVKNGRFSYGFFPDNQYTGPLTEAPNGSLNLKGDRVLIDQPAAGAYSEYVCVADGTSGDGYVGTWKGVGLVQA
jgi:hypothetical protein